MCLWSHKTIRKLSLVMLLTPLVVSCERHTSNTADAPVIFDTVMSPDGIPIHYEVHGAGTPALVFIHGWSCDRSYWKHQLEFFSSAYRVVTVDIAGHGESGLGREAWTIESFGDDVAAVVKKLDIRNAILIGHSMGGDVALAAAHRLRGRVQSLVMVDTYKELGSPRTAAEINEIIAPFRADFEGHTQTYVRNTFAPGADAALVEQVAVDMSKAPQEVALGAIESSLTSGQVVTTPLADLQLPVIAINPDDSTTDVASMERHGVEVVLIPGVGHFPMLEDPAAFNQVLMKVVSGR